MRSRIETLAASAAVALTALATSGCGEATIDVDKATRFIEKAASQQIGSSVKSVTCPGTVKVEAKQSFQCVVTASDGTHADARLTQKDGKGNLLYSPLFLPTRDAERIVQRQLRRQSPGTTVHCPEIVSLAKGATFECEATADGTTKTVSAKQTDARGNFTYRLR